MKKKFWVVYDSTCDVSKTFEYEQDAREEAMHRVSRPNAERVYLLQAVAAFKKRVVPDVEEEKLED
jgi:hypothetical protein